MVAATRGVTGEGRLVGEANPHPLWGLILAAMSGFDGERLWRLYRFVPWLSLLCLGFSVAFYSGGALDDREELTRGTLAGLTGWLLVLAPLVDELHVITLYQGAVDLPDNVRVYSLGKERGDPQWIWAPFLLATPAVVATHEWRLLPSESGQECVPGLQSFPR